ncbi:hypothetical protein SGFS_069610 [Streptomyces graminofaciens]|jgi:hypothetical protein|uniref:Transmembrane protein n=2 Tax=Streptomyces graminofaciens TaxID=68212 RepID=A0ABN5VQC8_9ACTN|nr:hypothetical protein [Streptomyces graminofaciens]BBC35667.1 hypothetical protein SGFS_069610 [Streptomyces graminofaciens]
MASAEGGHGGGPGDGGRDEGLGESVEKRRLAEEKKNERYVWWSLGYFLFGIHVVAFVMIYAVTHAK